MPYPMNGEYAIYVLIWSSDLHMVDRQYISLFQFYYLFRVIFRSKIKSAILSRFVFCGGFAWLMVIFFFRSGSSIYVNVDRIYKLNHNLKKTTNFTLKMDICKKSTFLFEFNALSYKTVKFKLDWVNGVEFNTALNFSFFFLLLSNRINLMHVR